jgi:hypothetical protein
VLTIRRGFSIAYPLADVKRTGVSSRMCRRNASYFSGTLRINLNRSFVIRLSGLIADRFAQRSNCCTVTVCVIAGCGT